MTESILFVDDEAGVRRSLREWLEAGFPACRLLEARDDLEAMRVAVAEREAGREIDVAILDWNLGAGVNGLELLENLAGVHPDILAILITAFAQQTTPLDAMRGGVRDYLAKGPTAGVSAERKAAFDRPGVIAAVERLFGQIRPAKRQRAFRRQVELFRDAVRELLPTVQSAALLSEGAAPSRGLLAAARFARAATGAGDAVIVLREFDDAGERVRAFDGSGVALDGPLVPFARSLAAGVVASGGPLVLNSSIGGSSDGVEWQAFEAGRSNLLALPLLSGPGVQAALELFDKPSPGFGESDFAAAQAAGEVAAELLRATLADRRASRVLADAIEAALRASESAVPDGEASPDAVGAGLRGAEGGIDRRPDRHFDGDAAVRLAEAVRELAAACGPSALEHCERVVRSTRELLAPTGDGP